MGEGPCSPGSVALVVGVTVAVAVVSGAWLTAPAQATQATQPIERDSVLMRVDVQEDGTANWRIEYRTRLDDANTTQAFRELEDDIEENPEAYSGAFFEGINSTIATAENSTDREMAGTNFSVHTEVNHLPQRYGVVVYSFTWQGFAAVEDDQLRLGDALSGLFLGEDERLLVSWPNGYETEDVHPDPDERRTRAVIWTGPMEFGPNEPRLVVAQASGSWNWEPIAAALVGLAVLVGGAWWLYRREGRLSRQLANGDPELLSNEERVIQVLREHGGRAKQQEIVDALDWTEAKTSRVISTLREQGRIDSFRLGRENVLALPDIEE